MDVRPGTTLNICQNMSELLIETLMNKKKGENNSKGKKNWEMGSGR